MVTKFHSDSNSSPRASTEFTSGHLKQHALLRSASYYIKLTLVDVLYYVIVIGAGVEGSSTAYNIANITDCTTGTGT